jgi:hypothetical protein
MKTDRKGTGWEGMGWINLFQDGDIADTEACESFFVFSFILHLANAVLTSIHIDCRLLASTDF